MKRNYFLDIIKGLCALFITATHYIFTADDRLRYLFPFWIDMAVPIFMMITGYVGTISYRKKNITTIEAAYDWHVVITKALRYSIPFVMAWLLEFIRIVYINGIHDVHLPAMLIHFAQGGEGPGAYYYPLLMQLIIVFPLLYFLIERQGFFGLVLMFLATYLMEFLKIVYQMGDNTYCLLMFRYTFIICVGIYLGSSHYKKRNAVAVASFIAGVAFLIFTQYAGCHIPYINVWVPTSLFGCLYIAPLVAFGIRNLGELRFRPLELLGRASYNIFLAQKVYYYTMAPWIYDHVANQSYWLPINLVVSVFFGIMFYFVEGPITTYVVSVVNKAMDRHSIPSEWR